MTLRGDDGAASSVIGFAIAGVIFLAAVGLLMVLARTSIPAPQESDADPAGRIQAESALELLLTEGTSSAGSAGWLEDPVGGQAWTHDANATGVPGLLEPGGRHLDPLKIAVLLEGGPAGLDPDELRAGLGLERANGIHLRVTPLLPPLEDGAPALNLTVRYVAGPDPDVALAEWSMLDALLAGSPTNATAGALGLGGCATDVLVYGTDHADSAPGADAAQVAAAVECGMTLVLLGSATPCSSCLADLVAAAPTPSPCAPLVVDDLAHPVVTAPNVLGASGYAPHGALPALGAAAGAFEAAAGSLPAPVLAASLCGSFGDGQVLLARVSPTEAFGGGRGTTEEGTRLLHNLLARHEQAMSFSFGDTMPGGSAAVPAQAVVPGPVLGDEGRVPVRVALWVF